MEQTQNQCMLFSISHLHAMVQKEGAPRFPSPAVFLNPPLSACYQNACHPGWDEQNAPEIIQGDWHD